MPRRPATIPTGSWPRRMAADLAAVRQERDWNQEEDAIIAIAPEDVSAFVDKLTDVIGIPNAGK